MNSCNFAGRLGHDGSLNYTPGGDAILEFSLAVDVRKRGEKQTLWVKCKLWGERAEKVQRFFTKGSSVAVTGRVEVEAWKSREGEARAGLVLWVGDFTLLGGGQEREQPRQNNLEPRAVADQADGGFNDDIPF